MSPTASDLLPGRHAPRDTGACRPCSSRTTGPFSTCESSPKAWCRQAIRSPGPGAEPSELTIAEIDALLYLPNGEGNQKLESALDVPAFRPVGGNPFKTFSTRSPRDKQRRAELGGLPGTTVRTRSSPKAPPSPPSTSPRGASSALRPRAGPASTSPCASRRREGIRSYSGNRNRQISDAAGQMQRRRSAATSTRNCKSEPASKPRRRGPLVARARRQPGAGVSASPGRCSRTRRRTHQTRSVSAQRQDGLRAGDGADY